MKDNPDYFYCEYLSEISEIFGKMELFAMRIDPDVLNFESGLLTGEFFISERLPGGFRVATGTAFHGYLDSLTIALFEFNYKTGERRITEVSFYEIGKDSVFETKKYEQDEAIWSQRPDTVKKVTQTKKDSFLIRSRYIITDSEELLKKDDHFSFESIFGLIDMMKHSMRNKQKEGEN